MEDLFYTISTLSFILLLSSLLILIKLNHNNKKNPNTNPNPPSPPGLPLIGHLHLLKQPIHRALAHLSDLHGPILLLRFGSRRVLLVSSSSGANECFTVNDIIFANRPRLLAGKHLGYNYNLLVWISYGPHWRNLRRITTLEVLSTTRVLSSSYIRSDEVLILVKTLLRDYSGSGFHFTELRTKIFGLAYNIVMRMLANKRYYGDADESSSEAGKEFREFTRETFTLSGTSNAADFLPVVRWLGIGGHERRLKRLSRRKNKFFQGLVDEHRMKKESRSQGLDSSPAGTSTVIDLLLSMQESDPEHCDNDMIKAFIELMVVAGTDTSAATMEWTMALLLNNPQTLEKLRAEIDAYVSQGSLLQEADFPKLPYLHAVINESMRMYPAGPLLFPHESSQDCTVGGFNVPSGTMILVNAWKIQRDPELWEEPEKFKPERFLRTNTDQKSTDEAIKEGVKMMPFGMGRRRCPGEGLAMKMVPLVIGTLVQCFEWERVGDEEVDMSEGIGSSMPKAKPLEAMFKPRESLAALLNNL
ncbi:putative oxidoreductase [Dioscorea sansibarensis]